MLSMIHFDFDFVFLGSKITGSSFMDRALEIGLYQQQGLKLINADAQRFPTLRAKILKTMPTIYRSSKICLDISHFTNIDGYTSNRYWNISDSRIYFDTFEEAIEKKNYYLKHPEKLEPIRKRALEVAKLHEYTERFLEMFKAVY